jgi:hypothetical protein
MSERVAVGIPVAIGIVGRAGPNAVQHDHDRPTHLAHWL